ncbi:MAG: hypothetical protein CMF37_15945 [Leeuwenhoekiella sp.]|nr:hypothetical protein [Leeuwenhoekiella sp.]
MFTISYNLKVFEKSYADADEAKIIKDSKSFLKSKILNFIEFTRRTTQKLIAINPEKSLG